MSHSLNMRLFVPFKTFCDEGFVVCQSLDVCWLQYLIYLSSAVISLCSNVNTMSTVMSSQGNRHLVAIFSREMDLTASNYI